MNIDKIINIFKFEKLEIYVLDYFPYAFNGDKLRPTISPANLFVKFVYDQFYEYYDSPLWNMSISDFYDFMKYFCQKYSTVPIAESIFNTKLCYKQNGSLEREYIKYKTGLAEKLLADPEIILDDDLKKKLKRQYNI